MRVYCITFPNGKRYVGVESTKGQRKSSHKKARSNQVVHSAIRKYGWDNCQWEYLTDDLPDEQAFLQERSYIQQWNLRNRDFGYNKSEGGESGSKGCHWTDEMKQRLSNTTKGRPGKTLTEEAKRKIKEANSKKVRSDNFKQRVSEFHTGRKNSQETRQRMSEAAKKRPKRVTSEETKEKLRIASKRAMLKRLGRLDELDNQKTDINITED